MASHTASRPIDNYLAHPSREVRGRPSDRHRCCASAQFHVDVRRRRVGRRKTSNGSTGTNEATGVGAAAARRPHLCTMLPLMP
jgi:hypothetical protein